MRISVLLVFFLVLLGLAGYAYSQNVITTTTTRVVTVPGTTFVTETVISGTTVLATVQIPGFLLIIEDRVPDQVCTVYFTATQPPSVIIIPGATIPGTTFSTVVSQKTYAVTNVYAEGGATSTRTGVENVQVVFMGFTTRLPLYGIVREFCERITVTGVYTVIVDTVPATLRFAFEGYSFPGTTLSLTMQLPSEFLVTTMFTKTKTGTTERFTTSYPGTYTTVREVVSPTTIRQTVTSPGTTYVETYTTVITLAQTTTTPTTPTTPATTTPTTATPTQTIATKTTTPQPAAGFPIDLLLPAVAIAVVVVVVVIALRLRG